MRLRACILAAIVVSVSGCDAPTVEAHWGYAGEEGPARWAALSPDFSLCAAGKEQSPIDLSGGSAMTDAALQRVVGKVALDFERRATVLDLVDNGHTIQVTPNARVGVDIDGKHYELAQYHFHSPSEHSIDGERYPLEAHFVTSTPAGELAVIGVLYEEGEHESAYDAVIAGLPQRDGQTRHLEGLELDLDSARPLGNEYFVYRGSLTTPPCSEGVRWLVVSEPEEMSAAQLKALTAVLHENARPIQALNDRELLRVTFEE